SASDDRSAAAVRRPPPRNGTIAAVDAEPRRPQHDPSARTIALGRLPARRRTDGDAAARRRHWRGGDQHPTKGGVAVTGVALQFIVVGAALFALGAVGFLVRRNLIIMFLCVELMLQGATLNLIGFSRYHGNLQGQSFVVFLLATAASESAIAL